MASMPPASLPEVEAPELPWQWLIYSDKLRLGKNAGKVLLGEVSVLSPMAVALFADLTTD